MDEADDYHEEKEGVLLEDTVLAERDLRESIRGIKKKYIRERAERDVGLVPSKLTYRAISEARKKDLEPSRVFEVLLNYEEVMEEALKEASERRMDPVDVARVFKNSEEPQDILEEAESSGFTATEVMKVKENFPGNWRKVLDVAKERGLNPMKIAETMDKLPGYVEEAFQVASERNLDPLSVAMTMKFYPEISKEAIDIASKYHLNPDDVARTKDRFTEEIFKKAVEAAGARNIDLYWAAKCFEEYTERRTRDIFSEAEERKANPYIIARMLFGRGNRNRASYEVSSAR